MLLLFFISCKSTVTLTCSRSCLAFTITPHFWPRHPLFARPERYIASSISSSSRSPLGRFSSSDLADPLLWAQSQALGISESVSKRRPEAIALDGANQAILAILHVSRRIEKPDFRVLFGKLCIRNPDAPQRAATHYRCRGHVPFV